MATYKVTDTDLNKVTRLLDKINNHAYPFTLDDGLVTHADKLTKLRNEAKKLSKEIKDKYTKIK